MHVCFDKVPIPLLTTFFSTNEYESKNRMQSIYLRK